MTVSKAPPPMLVMSVPILPASEVIALAAEPAKNNL